MAGNTLVPYRVPQAPIELIPTGQGLTVDADARIIDLSGSESQSTTRVNVRAIVPSAELAALGYSYPSTWVVLRCRATDLRTLYRLRPSETEVDAYIGVCDLDREMLRGDVTITGLVTAEVDGIPARKLAESEPWYLIVDSEVSRSLRGSLDVRWEDFGEIDHLRSIKDEPFWLDLDSPLPVVYLNKRIEGLAEVLPTTGVPAGPLRPVYETLRTGIARSVWLTLLDVALSGIVASDDRDDEPQWPLVKWQEDVLRLILPRVYLNESDGECLQRAYAARFEEARRELMGKAVGVIEKDLVRDGTALRRGLKVLADLGNVEVIDG